MERSQFGVPVGKGCELVPVLAEKNVFIGMLDYKKFTGFWLLPDNKEDNNQNLFSIYSFLTYFIKIMV